MIRVISTLLDSDCVGLGPRRRLRESITCWAAWHFWRAYHHRRSPTIDNTVRNPSIVGSWMYLNDNILGKWPGPSWVSTTRFLQSTLKLNYVVLNGQLANGKNENWKIHPLEACPAGTNTGSKLYHGENSSRSRMKRYILHGGECPISSDEFSQWEREWAEAKRGDCPWYSCEWSSLDHRWKSVIYSRLM